MGFRTVDEGCPAEQQEKQWHSKNRTQQHQSLTMHTDTMYKAETKREENVAEHWDPKCLWVLDMAEGWELWHQ
jgi:hypothetical protein